MRLHKLISITVSQTSIYSYEHICEENIFTAVISEPYWSHRSGIYVKDQTVKQRYDLGRTTFTRNNGATGGDIHESENYGSPARPARWPKIKVTWSVSETTVKLVLLEAFAELDVVIAD